MQVEISEGQLRRWLSLLGKPDQLASDETVALLRAHNRLPATQNKIAIGEAAAALLIGSIERLKPPEGSTRDRSLPHDVLKLCFVQGLKLFQAAAALNLSERQLSRERARAVSILKSALETPATERAYTPERIPTITGFFERPAQILAIKATLEQGRIANIHGPPGVGKTSLIAELAAEFGQTQPVLWHRFRPGVNVTLPAILCEIGERLYAEGHPELAEYIDENLSQLDTALGTQLCLKGLSRAAWLLIFDDFHTVQDDVVVRGFIEELVTHLPTIRIITIGRHRLGEASASSVEIPPLSRAEMDTFLSLLNVHVDHELAQTLHQWTNGNVHLARLAASWLRTASPDEVARGVASLREQEEVQTFLLGSVTELLDSDDRAILDAASIFHDRFSDDALAFVTGQTRGNIMDASRRLVRLYVATRSREGDTAFFHTSIRDYIYERLDPVQRFELHSRAAQWYKRKRQPKDADLHARRAAQAEQEARRSGMALTTI